MSPYNLKYKLTGIHFVCHSYNDNKRQARGDILFRRRTIRQLGVITIALGAGIIISVLIPYWGWMIAIGGGVIALGWFIMNKFC